MNTYMTSIIAASLIKFISKTELTKHFTLKTSDRAPNKEHCQTVCNLAIEAYQKDREGFVKLASEMSYNSLSRFMMAATGRPYKDRKSGKNTGGQMQADAIATLCLTELAYFVGQKRPDVKYANCTMGLIAEVKMRSKKVRAPATRKRTTKKTA